MSIFRSQNAYAVARAHRPTQSARARHPHRALCATHAQRLVLALGSINPTDGAAHQDVPVPPRVRRSQRSARREVAPRKMCPRHLRRLAATLRSVYATMADVEALFYPPPAGFPSVDYSGCRSKQDFAEARWNAWKDFVPPGGSSRVVIYRPRHLR